MTRVHSRIPNGHPRDDPRVEVGEDVCVGVGVRVGPMEFKLNYTWWAVQCDRFLPRDAMLSAVHAVVVCLSVCVCVCLSVTLRYYMKTSKRRITQIIPHDKPVTLVSILASSSRGPSAITELLVKLPRDYIYQG